MLEINAFDEQQKRDVPPQTKEISKDGGLLNIVWETAELHMGSRIHASKRPAFGQTLRLSKDF